jgi:sirohydrochlorin cobaltochelatase
MLLVSGNHYYNDMIDIANDLRSDFNSFVAKPLNECDRFNILDLKATQEIVLNNIKEEIIKLGI